MASSLPLKILLCLSLLDTCFSAAPGLIDIHHHIFPEAQVPELVPDGGTVGINVTTLADHIPFMDSLNITTAMLMPSILKEFTFGTTAMTGPELLNLSIRALHAQLDAVHANPLRFGSFVMIPLPHVNESLEFVDLALNPTNGTLRPDGFALTTAMGNLYMGDPSFFPVYEKLNAANATVFIHPIDTTDPPELTFQGAVLEYPFDTARCVLHMMTTGVFTLFPNIHFIFAHNGGAFPFLADRIHYQREDLDVQAANNNLTIRDLLATSNIFWDTSQSAPFQWPVTLAIEIPKDKILHGTDWPFTVTRGVAPVGKLAPQASGCFSEAEIEVGIARSNAFQILPRIKAEFLKNFGGDAVSTEGLGTQSRFSCPIVPLLEPEGI